MQHRLARREFLLGIGAAAGATAALPFPLKKLCAAELLYPPIDLSYFDTPISPAPGAVHFGCASINWTGRDRQAIEDIGALGFPGIQLRSTVVKQFASPAELGDLLDEHRLKMAALSGGSVRIDPALEAEEIARHTANAKFVREAGGRYLEVTDLRPEGRRVITRADYARLGKVITEIGKRTADLGVSLGYHNHKGSLGDDPLAVDRILEAADPRYAKLTLDVADYFEQGVDPAEAIEKYNDRLLVVHIVVHIKDVAESSASGEAARADRFVEPGRGKVDLPAVFRALDRVSFRGWAVVESEAAPDESRTPKQRAAIAKRCLEEKLGVIA